MTRTIKRRIGAVEKRTRPKRVGLQAIMIEGGLPGPIRWAEGGGQVWERAVDETFDAFENRVIANVKAAGLKSVMIVGLPPLGVQLGSLEEFLSTFDFPEVPPEET
jgi:hypothetical protein